MNDSREDQLRCWFNRFHPADPPCGRPAVWQSFGLGNMMDASQWCAEHPPDPLFRRRIAAAPQGGNL